MYIYIHRVCFGGKTLIERLVCFAISAANSFVSSSDGTIGSMCCSYGGKLKVVWFFAVSELVHFDYVVMVARLILLFHCTIN